MFDFIRMWLVLRVLQYQEDVLATQGATEGGKPIPSDLIMGGVFADRKPFVAHVSTMNLWKAVLPKRLRASMFPLTVLDEQRVKRDKVRKLYSLIRLADQYGYIESCRDNPVEDMRLSPSGDNFITYWGGLNALIKTYPHAWGLLVITLLPYWAPKLINELKERIP